MLKNTSMLSKVFTVIRTDIEVPKRRSARSTSYGPLLYLSCDCFVCPRLGINMHGLGGRARRWSPVKAGCGSLDRSRWDALWWLAACWRQCREPAPRLEPAEIHIFPTLDLSIMADNSSINIDITADTQVPEHTAIDIDPTPEETTGSISSEIDL